MTANATVIVSTDTSDFILTFESFLETGFSVADIVSESGNITLDIAQVIEQGIGEPATEAAAYTAGYTTDWASSILTYVISGDENFDVLFSSAQTAFAMNYEDDSIESEFTLSFFNGELDVGSASFTTGAPFNTVNFIGFISDTSFNKVTIREDDGDNSNSNEMFQFYTATPSSETIPEPASLALMSLGLLVFCASRRKQKKN